MSNGSKRNLPRRQPPNNETPLPVVRPQGMPAQISDHGLLKESLKSLNAIIGPPSAAMREMGISGRVPSLPELRSAAASLPTLRAQWAAMDCPASAEQITIAIGNLVGSAPLASNINPQVFIRTAWQIVADMRPSIFEVEEATRRVLRSGAFLSIKLIADELEKQRRISKLHRVNLKAGHVEGLLEVAERDAMEARNPRLLERRLEREARDDAEQEFGELLAAFDEDTDKLLAAATKDASIHFQMKSLAEHVPDAADLVAQIEDHIEKTQRRRRPVSKHAGSTLDQAFVGSDDE